MTTWKPPIIERDLGAVAEWLWQLVESVPETDIRVLGTAEWQAGGRDTRLASLARWALVQLDDLSPGVIATRLAAEIAEGRRARLAAMKQASVAVSGALDWHAVAVRPTRAEVERRRAQPSYPGGDAA